MKKYIYIGLFVLVCGGLLSVFLLKKMEKFTPVEVLQAVPGSALLLAEGVDYEFFSEEFLPSNRIWVDLVNTSGWNTLDSTVQALVLRMGSHTDLHEILLARGFSLSFHLQGKKKLVPLVYIDYSDEVNDHEFEQLLLAFLGESSLVNQRKYESELLNEISGNPGEVPGKFTFSCVDGLCLLSPSSMILEEAIRGIHDEENSDADSELKRIRSTAGRYVHANIYVNYRHIHHFAQAILEEDAWAELKRFSSLGAWGELDLDVKEDAMILNGMTLPGSEGSPFLGVFEQQDPVKMELHELVPSGSISFMHIGISDKELFGKRLQAYLEARGGWPSIQARGSELESSYGMDPLAELFGLLDDELLRFQMEGDEKGEEQVVTIFETRSRSETVETVMRWLDQYLQEHTFDMSSYRSVYRLDQQTSFNIYRMPDFYKDKLVGRYVFNRYFCVYDKYLIFGPSEAMISQVIYKNVLHKTLGSDPVYREMSDFISNRSNLSIFLRPFAFLDKHEEQLSEGSQRLVRESELFLRRIPGLVIQYSSEGDLLYHSLAFRYTSQIKEKALTVWESLLDTVAVSKPALVVNHNTSEKEIFVQDASDKIYLINSTGRIVWKQKLEGRILGEVYQVDFYKNGKLQYLFNTGGKIHLIDRNGNYVDRYPITLRASATAPLALFDYENNKNYRIFVPASDRRVYAYDIEGKLVTGWKFGKSESVVKKALQHFRIGDRDYIVFSDQSRAYFLDRQGRERVKPGKRIVFSSANAFSLDMNIKQDKPRWISTDTSGNVIAVYTDGSVSRLLDHSAPAGHFFSTQDLNRDGIPEYLFAEGNELIVMDQDGKRLFSYKVREHISQMPDIYKFSASDLKIGITDGPRNRIYLLNSDGSLYEGFPLEGSTRFSIGYFAGSDSRFNLIVGSSNNFLYNYSIE